MSSVSRMPWRDIDPETAYRILRLRVDVFVVEQDCPYHELDGRDLEPDARHLWIESDGDIAAYLRVLRDDDAVRIGRVVTHARHRSAGLAARLIRFAMDTTEGPWVLDAQSHLADWYGGFGFRRVGPEFVEDGIAHVEMRVAGPGR